MIPLLTLAVLGLLAACAATDIAERRIPNRLVLALVALAAIRLGVGLWIGQGGAAWSILADVAAAGAIFGLGVLAFHVGAFGGGDVKLLAAGALWTGAASLWPFLFLTACAGGILAVLFIVARRLRPGRWIEDGLPYGVAIAAGCAGATLLPL